MAPPRGESYSLAAMNESETLGARPKLEDCIMCGLGKMIWKSSRLVRFLWLDPPPSLLPPPPSYWGENGEGLN